MKVKKNDPLTVDVNIITKIRILILVIMLGTLVMLIALWIFQKNSPLNIAKAYFTVVGTLILFLIVGLFVFLSLKQRTSQVIQFIGKHQNSYNLLVGYLILGLIVFDLVAVIGAKRYWFFGSSLFKFGLGITIVGGLLFFDHAAINGVYQRAIEIHHWFVKLRVIGGEITLRPASIWWKLLILLVIIVTPITIAVINDEWLYTPVGEQDPFWYVGYGYQYLDETFENDNYKISRLPWILVQFLVRNIFGPIETSWIMTLGFLALGSIGFYLTASQWYGRLPSFIGAVSLSTYTHFMVSRAPDYHNTPAGPLYIWGYLALTLAASSTSHKRRWYFVAGVILALAVHCAFGLIFLFPVLVVHVILINIDKKQSLWTPMVLLAIGALSATFLLGLINLSVGRSFFFFIPQLEYIFNLQSTNELLSYYRLGRSVFPLTHTALPFATTIIATVFLAKHWRFFFTRPFEIEASHLILISLCVQLLLAVMIWSIMEFNQKAMLIFDFNAYPLIFPTFFVFVGILSKGMASRSESLHYLIVIPCLFAFPLILGIKIPLSQNLALPLLVVGYTLLYLYLVSFSTTQIVVLILLTIFSFLNATGGYNLDRYQITNRFCHVYRDAYLSIIDAHVYLSRYNPSHAEGRIHLWWDEKEELDIQGCPEQSVRMQYIGNSITRTRIRWLYDSEPPPALAQIPSEYLEDQIAENDGIVALMTNNQEHVEYLYDRLGEIGNWEIFDHKRITHGDIDLIFTLIQLERQ